MDDKTPHLSAAAALGYSGAEGYVPVGSATTSGMRSYLLDRAAEKIGINAIHFSGDRPLVYFADTTDAGAAEIHSLQRGVWNDARVPLLIVSRGTDICVYDGYKAPATDPEDVDEDGRLVATLRLTVDAVHSELRFDRWSVESGVVWERHPNSFDPKGRCDQRLISNLQFARGQLRKDGLPDGVIHRLIPRLILILYLDHRGVLSRSFYQRFGATDLFSVLRSKQRTYSLFAELQGQFNGDLFPVEAAERKQVTGAHLDTLAELLSGTRLENGQRSLWPLYDFSIIPIQLVSAIYESFMKIENNAIGAVYTPIELVELLLNEVLPWPTSTTGGKLPTVIDPSCGSGIFLVEAYKRIVALWKQQNPNERHSAANLKRLLVEHIFGIERERGAAQVAAFSLYLALLDHLEPRHIWRSVRFPSMTESSLGRTPNIQVTDAFARSDERRFDLVIGNPPWKRNFLPVQAKRYCEARDYPIATEIAQAFMWRARDYSSPDGRVALLTPAKWLFNREGPDAAFRRAFLSMNYVTTVVNLAALRTSGLFADAVGPTAAIVFAPLRPQSPSESILYCVPKRRARRSVVRLLLDAGDIKWLPRLESESKDDLWKVMMWAGWRDLALVRRAGRGRTLAELAAIKGWAVGRGFQPYDPTRNQPKKLKPLKRVRMIGRLPFVDARDIRRFSLHDQAFGAPFHAEQFVEPGRVEAYAGPHVLVKEGLSRGRFTAAYTAKDCTFRDTITGVHGPNRNALKALTVYLNSSFASYFLFLTSATWGVERERIKISEMLRLPALPLEDPKTIETLAGLYDRKNSFDELEFQREIDDAVAAAFTLSRNDVALIEDLVRLTIPPVDPADDGTRQPSMQALSSYADAFLASIAPMMGPTRPLEAIIREPGNAPLIVMSFVVRTKARIAHTGEHGKDLDEVLERLDRVMLRQRTPSIFVRRHLRYYESDMIHVVKPAEERFWSRSAALTDVDETIAEVVSPSLYATE